MVGLTSVEVKESLEALAAQLQPVKTPKDKERLQVLYWLKQDKPPSISALAKATGKHRNTLQTWLMQYRNGGVEAMLEVKKAPGGVRVIPQGAEEALAKRLQEAGQGFASYGAVQQWLSETLGVEAEDQTVYQMTRQRLKAKLKVARPQNGKQDAAQRAAFEQTLPMTSCC
ncbi:winged helix-turn-helix domain-containing protein [Leptolyngbya sp. FACHB-321]|uniref:helix-turn-helix domain-containing protein n=1 Tax=Leptolyngbya sp. FACHB-321 TaxID=2692807 RepID=UPI001689E57F|nr:winged helix-turn-helix domain-containing protein [Leptolyngbya sp. FACHB-321]MBD2035181.1 winged helix-turn-helix domain-containing protein [Leptolyngbya sp. FACHB-321]